MHRRSVRGSSPDRGVQQDADCGTERGRTKKGWALSSKLQHHIAPAAPQGPPWYPSPPCWGDLLHPYASQPEALGASISGLVPADTEKNTQK